MLEAKETETNPSGLGVFIFSFLPIKPRLHRSAPRPVTGASGRLDLFHFLGAPRCRAPSRCQPLLSPGFFPSGETAFGDPHRRERPRSASPPAPPGVRPRRDTGGSLQPPATPLSPSGTHRLFLDPSFPLDAAPLTQRPLRLRRRRPLLVLPSLWPSRPISAECPPSPVAVRRAPSR